ncbi:Flp family type IVb pilin [Solirhodobacter olei]|uniref:Flp family type IVb pilin n=1 Tax=Solirhodobacter olei TaxID=2493082 RepID=UPI000FDCAC3D|nr:Flp family type IVb pilin [Solirhodobacter olei]
MKSFKTFLKRFHKDEKGVTLVEYGIALTLALIVGGTALTNLAGSVSNQMGVAQTALCAGAAGATTASCK